MDKRRIDNPFEKSLNTFLQGGSGTTPAKSEPVPAPAPESAVERKQRAARVTVSGIPKKRGEGKSRSEGLKEGYVRYSFVVREEMLEELKLLSWWRRDDMYVVMGEALSDFLRKRNIREEVEKARESKR